MINVVLWRVDFVGKQLTLEVTTVVDPGVVLSGSETKGGVLENETT